MLRGFGCRDRDLQVSIVAYVNLLSCSSWLAVHVAASPRDLCGGGTDSALPYLGVCLRDKA